MDPCVYTTQHGTWLRAAAVDCSPTPVCFRSGKRWKKAHQLLTSPATLRVLFREQDETTPVLACRFVADHLATDRARRAELQERLWLQRDTIIKSKSYGAAGFLGHGLRENPMSKEVGGMVGSKRVKGAVSARTGGTRCHDVIFETLFETLWVSNPIRPRSAASRNRVMRGPGVTQGAKRSQGARRPRD